MLDLRNAELASALAIAQQRSDSDANVCADIVDRARADDYVGTLQAATRLASRYHRLP